MCSVCHSVPAISVLGQRRWSTGRLVVSGDHADTNLWLNHSELSIAGRPLTESKIFLPRQRDLLLPESVSADTDLRLSERLRPSHKEVSAQKGREKLAAMWQSLFKLADWQPPGPVLICNLTGYVEDAGVSVPFSQASAFHRSGMDACDFKRHLGKVLLHAIRSSI